MYGDTRELPFGGNSGSQNVALALISPVCRTPTVRVGVEHYQTLTSRYCKISEM